MARRNNPHNDHGYREAVGGIVPGYAGHRPGGEAVHGETAFGGVPGHLESERAPGQGWSVDRRDTTAFQELGSPYKWHAQDKAEAFREVVGGVKSGYHGHIPGAQNHIGSAHVGGVPLHDFDGPSSMRPQYQPRDPRWATESSRQGPRGQVGGVDTHLELAPGRGIGGSGYTPPGTPAAHAHRTMRGPTPPPSQRPGSPNGYAGPNARGGQPPRHAQQPGLQQPTVGYAGHRFQERDMTDESVRMQVEAYNNTGAGDRGPKYSSLSSPPRSNAGTPPASTRTRQTIAGTRSGGGSSPGPGQMQQAYDAAVRAAAQQEVGMQQQQAPTYIYGKPAGLSAPPDAPLNVHAPGNSGRVSPGRVSPGRVPPKGGSSAKGRQYLALAESGVNDYHAHNHGVKAMNRGGTPRQAQQQSPPGGGARSGQREAFMAASRVQQQQSRGTPPASQRSQSPSQRAVEDGNWTPPSWDQLRSTPQEQVYRNNVGGVKLGYSGHIPSRDDNVGSSNYGASNHMYASQRDHGTRMYGDAVQPDHMITGKASSSAVGYAGHHPTKQESVGVSYWQAAAGGAEPRFAQGSHDMRDLLSA